MRRAFLVFAVGFAALWAGSHLFFADPSLIDTARSAFTYDHEAQTIYLSDNQQVVLARRRLATGTPKVLVLGSSNVQEGLRPPILAPYVPGWEVHNLSISATNTGELRQIVSLVDEYLPPNAPTVVVIGMWYGLFVDDRTRWRGHRSNIAGEAMRIDLYRERDGALERRVPRVVFEAATELLRPYLVLDGGARRVAHRASCALFGQTCIGVRDRETMTPDAAERAAILQTWVETLGAPPLPDEQFTALASLARSLRESGRRLLLVDLPIPRWHADRSALFADYQARKRRTLDALIAGGARYLDLQALDDEADFYDGTHPRPSRARRWSEPVGEVLRALVRP